MESKKCDKCSVCGRLYSNNAAKEMNNAVMQNKTPKILSDYNHHGPINHSPNKTDHPKQEIP